MPWSHVHEVKQLSTAVVAAICAVCIFAANAHAQKSSARNDTAVSGIRVAAPDGKCNTPGSPGCVETGVVGVCAPGAGNCLEPNGTPGCEDPVCCDAVCFIDPFCCDVEWDQICADEAAAEPDCQGNCGTPGAGDCYVANGTPGCDQAGCCIAVCVENASCCDVEWTAICADIAATLPSCADRCEAGVEAFDGLTPFSTVGATTDGPDYDGDPDCGEFGDDTVHNDLWFDYFATCTGDLLVTTCEDLGGGATFDTRLAIHDGCGTEPLCPADAALDCNDDDPINPCGTADGGYLSTLIVAVLQGQCYKIRVGGFDEIDTGSGVLKVDCGVPQGCSSVADCADLDQDGIRDDPCLWWACEPGAGPGGLGTCVSSFRQAGQADLGGLLGDCPIDGACDGNDSFHALNCFENINTAGVTPYPCENNTPNALNVDGVGLFGSCVLDGICDGNDAFGALNCFGDIDTAGMSPFPCSCVPGGGPAPQVAAATQPAAVARTAVQLVAPAAVLPGERVEVDVHLAAALQDLRGYQLHLGVAGGSAGRLKLVDIRIDEDRADFALGGMPHWRAFNVGIGQMVAGVDAVGARTKAGAYLATFTFEADTQAAGTFVVDVLYDDRRAVPEQRTFLFASPLRKIGVSGTRPAMITIGRGAGQHKLNRSERRSGGRERK